MIWGDKTSSLFDYWSIEHFICGIALGIIVTYLSERGINKFLFKNSEKKILIKNGLYERMFFYINLLIILILSLIWEVFEHYLELGLRGNGIQTMLVGEEFRMNRLISDPIFVVFGYIFYSRNTNIQSVAKIFSAIWLLIHIILIIDSMYMNNIISITY